MPSSPRFRRGFALLFVLFLLCNSIAGIRDAISADAAVTGFAIAVGVVIAGEALWRGMRRRSSRGTSRHAQHRMAPRQR